MQLQIELLNSWQVLTALGINIQDRGTCFEFEDAQMPGMQFRLVGQGIIETSETGRFLAGSLLDYLAVRSGGYLQAIDYLIHTYGDTLAASAFAPIVYREADALEATGNRTRFRQLMAMRGNIFRDNKFMLAKCWLEKYGIVEAVANMLIGMTFDEITTMLPGKWAKTGEYVLFPYMRNPWTIAGFQVVNVKTEVSEIAVEHRSRTSFFGLQGCGHLPVTIHKSDLAVCQAYSSSFIDPLQVPGHVFVHIDSQGAANDYQLTSGILPLNQPFATLLAYRRAFANLQVKTEDSQINLSTYLVQEMLKMLSIEDRTGVLNMLLMTLKKDRDLQAVIEAELRAAGHPEVVQALQQRLDQGVEYTWRKFTILETPEGLMAKGPHSCKLFANFTVHIDHSLTFPDNREEIFYIGRVLFMGQQFPIQIRRANMNRYRDIEALVIAAVTRSGRNVTKLPAFIDTTYQGALNAVLDRQTAEATALRGISCLGWARDHFVTPTWSVDPLGITPSSMIPHPGRSNFLQFCSFAPFSPTDQRVPLPAACWYVIALTVGMMIRSYMQAATGPIPVQRDPDTMRIISTVLLALNQQGPLKMNYSTRVNAERSFEGLNGFPCMTSCPIPSIVAAITQPCFLVGDAGMKLDHQLTQQEVMQTIWVARRVFQNVALRVLRTCGTDHGIYGRDTNDPANIAREGAEAIARYAGYRDIPLLDQGVVSGLSVVGQS